jgi:uncharacterized membrane protein YcaP (DUF421 family)
MFDVSHPWWHFVVRAALVYGTLLVLVRLSGKRPVGEFTPFDLIVVILLSESMQGALIAGDESLPGGMVAAVTLIAIDWVLGFASARSPRIERLLEGEPTVLVRDGVVQKVEMRRHNIPQSDLEEAVREAGLGDVEAVGAATLETDGKITVVPREHQPQRGQRPL